MKFFALTIRCIVGAAILLISHALQVAQAFQENNVRFEKNSKQMYDKYLENTPQIFRKKAKKNVDSAIARVCSEVVTEDDMYEVVRQTAPKLFQQTGFNILDELRTK